MKKSILVLLLLSSLCMFSQTIESIQKGYFNAVVGDSILPARTTERKAKDDGINYAIKHGYKGYRITFPEYVQVYLTDFDTANTVHDTVYIEKPPIIIRDTVYIEKTPETPKDTTVINQQKVYNFNPNEWGIVQGPTTSAIALNNRNQLKKAFVEAKNQGYDTFKIDDIDAYFEVSLVTAIPGNPNFYSSLEGVLVPSNFNLIMTDNTNLRVYPNNRMEYSLLSVRDAENVTITGGNLHGDRDAHDYSAGGSQEWGYLLDLHAAVNVVVDKVSFYNATGDGVNIHSLNFTFQPNYKPSHNIVVKNCFFDSNRRNNLSITDGYDMLITNNLFLNAGIDTVKSVGVLPGYALDVEAVRERNADGSYLLYEYCKDIVIENNIEKGSKEGSYIIAVGDYVTIKNNTAEGWIVINSGNNCVIENNVVTHKVGHKNITGIITGHLEALTTHSNIISGNTFTGFEMGMILYQRGMQIYNNTINESQTGIFIPTGITDTSIYYNTITSSLSGSKGLYAHSSTINNVLVYNNNINVKSNALVFDSVNVNAVNNTVNVYDNHLNTSQPINIDNSFGIILSK